MCVCMCTCVFVLDVFLKTALKIEGGQLLTINVTALSHLNYRWAHTFLKCFEFLIFLCFVIIAFLELQKPHGFI